MAWPWVSLGLLAYRLESGAVRFVTSLLLALVYGNVMVPRAARHVRASGKSEFNIYITCIGCCDYIIYNYRGVWMWGWGGGGGGCRGGRGW